MQGKKSKNLQRLIEAGFSVPDFITLGAEAELESISISWDVCAVRSSAAAEDGEATSFAGQFDTYLHVPKEEVPKRVRECFASMENKNAKAYAKQQNLNLEESRMHVIVQEMVDASLSGVCFTANPQGLLNEMVIVVGEGTGDGIVEDRVKTTTYYYHTTDHIYYYEGEHEYLKRQQVEELVSTVQKIQSLLGEYLDIEFAIADGKLYILQARDITTLNTENPLIFDNSNIVESYPGISLPLTCSFVNIVYTGIFKSLSRRVLRNDKVLNRYDEVLSHMVGNVNGRMYYQISNWYTVIKFLPMNQKIIPIWQEMLGVKNKSYESTPVRISPWHRAKTYYNVIAEMLAVPKNMEKLEVDFQAIQKDFYDKIEKNPSKEELIALYHSLHDVLLAKWDVTLLNDLYAFLFTGLVKKRLGTESNHVIAGISNIESMKPVRALVELAHDKKKLSEEEYEKRFWEYIRLYGDRHLEELKLESKTFRSHPALLTEKVQQYLEDETKLQDMYDNLHREVEQATPQKGINGFLAREAARGIAYRESSRLNRCRVFGMVRLLFTKLGEIYANEGLLETSDDVFWISVDEVFEMASTAQDRKEIVKKRKEDYEVFRLLPAYQRLIFAKEAFDKKHRRINAEEITKDANQLFGTPCSDGIVEGEVLVVTDIAQVKDYQDKILVTKMTDPGWVFLLIKAKGVIAEKGSLLSHTAIISREIKIPSIVGVEEVMQTLRSGDYIRMNGTTGEIDLIRRKNA